MSSTESDRGLEALEGSEEEGTQLIPIALPLDASLREHGSFEFVYPDVSREFKEHLAMQVAREFGLMPYNDCRSPDPEDRMAKARDGEFIIFSDSLKVGFRSPMHPFFVGFLVEYSMFPGQLMPNGWRMLVYFFIVCRCLGIVPSLDLCRVMFELKQLSRFTCFAYISSRGRFRTPRIPSSLKGWKDKWLYE